MTYTTCVIPCRMNSSRFPGKPLARLKGRELLLRVCDNAAKSIADHVVVASEDKLLVDFAIQNGYDAVLTHEHPTCTHRVCEVSKTLRSDYIVNLQGDEPCITPSMINAVINETVGKQYKMVQATYPIESNDLYDEDCVKAVINNGKIINLTRNPELYTENLRGIAGIYVYDIEAIRNFDKYDLRLVNAWQGLDTFGFIGQIDVIPYEFPQRTHAVDRPTDILTVEEQL